MSIIFNRTRYNKIQGYNMNKISLNISYLNKSYCSFLDKKSKFFKNMLCSAFTRNKGNPITKTKSVLRSGKTRYT